MGPSGQHGRLAWAGATACAIALACATAPGQDPSAEALERLSRGNHRFAAGQRAEHPRDEASRRSLARDHRPDAVVVTCSDSRVPPELVFDAGLGRLYTLRMAGNVCTPEIVAGVELAVERLGVRLCVVLAHEDCAAVRHCAQRLAPSDGTAPPASSAYERLLDAIEPAVRAAAGTDRIGRDSPGADVLARAEEENAQHTVQELSRRSPVLRSRLGGGHLRMVAARYHQDTGLVEWLPERPYAEPPAAQDAPEATTPASPPGAAPHMALRMLQAGHRRFVSSGALAGDAGPERRKSLAHGRQPFALVVTCADSRVVPELLFDAGLGDLHVLRVPGTAWTREVLASVEQAVRETGVSLCVVLGHRGCDDLAAVAVPDVEHLRTQSLRRLAESLEPAIERARREAGADPESRRLVDLAAAESARRTVRRLLQESRFLQRLLHEGRFDAVPALYDHGSGSLEWLRGEEPASPPAAPGPETAPDPGPAPAGQDAREPSNGAGPAPERGPAPPAETPPELSPESEVTAHRIRNHDLAMLVTLAGMLAVLGTGLLVWQRHCS